MLNTKSWQEKMGSILAWVAVGDLGGHTEVALPAQGKVMTVGL